MSLTLSKSCNPQYVRPGDSVIFTITIANTGTTSINDVKIYDPLPSCTTIANSSLDPSNGINLGTLSAGQIYTLHFTVLVYNDKCECIKTSNISPIIPNTAYATYAAYPYYSQSNTSNFVVMCDYIELEKRFEKVNNMIKYTVLVRNNSNITATNAYFYDTIPNCTSFNQNSLVVNGTTIPTASPVSGVYLGVIPTNSLSTITFDTTLIDECECMNQINSNYITNQAILNYVVTLCSTQPISGTNYCVNYDASVNSNVVTIPLACSTLKISKESCKCSACLGEKIPFVIRVTNISLMTIHNIVVQDSIPHGVYVSSYMPSIGGMHEYNKSLIWTIPNLGPGASAVATVVMVATDSVCFDTRGYIINKSNIVSYNSLSNINAISDSVITYIDCFNCKCNNDK